MSFLESEKGKGILVNGTGILEKFNDTGVVDMFGKMLKSAAESVTRQTSGTNGLPDSNIQEISDSQADELQEGPSMTLCQNLEQQPDLQLVTNMDSFMEHLFTAMF